jgi:selenocysteine lyase/cysteine desulfurase
VTDAAAPLQWWGTSVTDPAAIAGGMTASALPLAEQFGLPEGCAWLNCAHQGPLPRAAVEAAQNAIEQKQSPHLIPEDAFWDVPLRLKQAIGSLIGAPASKIILANSRSYGLNLLVQGLPWEQGDEVLVVAGDFPATVDSETCATPRHTTSLARRTSSTSCP